MPEKKGHFHMSENYYVNSSSQKAIGRVVISSAIEIARIHFPNPQIIRVLDIACGPGNLTIEFLHSLKSSFPNAKIDLMGFDYSEMNVNLLVKNSGGTIKGIVSSFYCLPIQTKDIDIIISNEGFQWQPHYAMSKIMFSYLGEPEKRDYELFALQNLETAFRNIYGSLKKGGMAVIQFGHHGQIKKIWDLVYDIFNEDPFQEYMNKVNFPVYHPTKKDILILLTRVGFLEKNINIDAFTQDITEETPLAITNFYRAFTQSGLSQFFNPDMLGNFYERMENKLNEMDIVAFRKDLLHRTLIKVIKE